MTMRNSICRFLVVLIVGQCTNLSFLALAEAQSPRYFDPQYRMSAPSLSGLPRLRFLTSLDFPPFNFADENKKPTGMNVDIARDICAQLQIEAKCEIQALPWEELVPALEAKRGEAIIAGSAISQAQREKFSLSHAYFQFPARLIAKNEWVDITAKDIPTALVGKKIAVVAGSAHEAMLKEFFPTAVPVPEIDIQRVYNAVKNGEADLAFMDGVASSFWLTSGNAESCCKFVGGPYYSSKYLGLGMAIVTRKEDVELTNAINATLRTIEDNGRYERIFEHYFPVNPHGDQFKLN